jgi:hypothetical protein
MTDKSRWLITATGPDGTESALLGDSLLIVGSDANAGLRLTGAGVHPVHLRVLPLADGRVLLINLAASGATQFNGAPLETSKTTPWQPGDRVTVGRYTLELGAVSDVDAVESDFDTSPEETAQPGVSSAPAAAAAAPIESPAPIPLPVEVPPPAPAEPSDPVIPAAWVDFEDPTPPKSAPLPLEVFVPPAVPLSALPDVMDEEEDTPPKPLPSLPPQPEAPLPEWVESEDLPVVIPPLPASVFDDRQTPVEKPVELPFGMDAVATARGALPYQPYEDEATARHAALPDAYLTPAVDMPAPGALATAVSAHMPPVIPLAGYGAPPADEFYTLPKDWHDAGGLSALMPSPQINLTARERVRVPVSVRNEYLQDVELQVFVTGLPGDWVSLPQPAVRVPAGSVGRVDLIIAPTQAVGQVVIEAAVRFQSIEFPSIAVALPFQVVIKAAPDLTGSLEPASSREGQPLYLLLQNHTQGTARVFIAGGGDGLYVTPAANEVQIPPGELARIPIHITPVRRSRWRGQVYPYWVSAREGSRAPLNYDGVVWVRAHWPLSRLIGLLLALLLVVALALLLVPPLLNRPDSAPPVVTPTPLPPPTFTPLAILPPTFTPLPTASPEATSVPTALPTAPFTDPRSSACAAAVPAPTGWTSYTVQRGDNLFRLALNRSTTIEEIRRVNCLSSLIAGDVILLPELPG